MSFFGTLFGADAQEEAAAKNATAALSTYQTGANQALQTGYDTGTTNLNSAIGAYSPLAALGSQYSQAGTMLGNALGTNGAAGTQAAQAAFTNAPCGILATPSMQACRRSTASAPRWAWQTAAMPISTRRRSGRTCKTSNTNTWLQNLSGAVGPGVDRDVGGGGRAGHRLHQSRQSGADECQQSSWRAEQCRIRHHGR